MKESPSTSTSLSLSLTGPSRHVLRAGLGWGVDLYPRTSELFSVTHVSVVLFTNTLDFGDQSLTVAAARHLSSLAFSFLLLALTLWETVIGKSLQPQLLL